MDVSVKSRAILDYREAVKEVEGILNRKMSEAFSEIKDLYGVTPTVVELDISEARLAGSLDRQGVYTGCRIKFGGE